MPSMISTNSLKEEFLANLLIYYRMVQHSTLATACLCETWIPFSGPANSAYASWVTEAQTALMGTFPVLLAQVPWPDCMDQRSWYLAISRSSMILMDYLLPVYTS